VRCERLKLQAASEAPELVARLRALAPARAQVAERVAEILAAVRSGGDRAVRQHTSRLDLDGRPAPPLRVQPAALERALAALERRVRDALELAAENVRRVAEAGLGSEQQEVRFAGHRVLLREVPVERAAVYVPGGRAPYPSTVVMGVVCARAAGVRHVAVCSPPAADGELHPAVLAACALTRADAVYRVGGAQAIAALAYGTETVAAVDVIAGPGNLWVQEAKRQVFGQVGIDGFAGPSDLLALADPDADPEPLALDLLAQAEHGAGTLVLAASPGRALLAELAARIEQAAETGAICALIELAEVEQGLALAQAFAPEHLQLAGVASEGLAARVTRAGCVFVGARAGTAFGDYVAGSNHVLPTDGAARFASALNPQSFRRRFTEVRIDEPAELARAAAPLARAEGFELHARSMEARISRKSGR
jgi:histidinol dehydrogenase